MCILTSAVAFFTLAYLSPLVFFFHLAYLVVLASWKKQSFASVLEYIVVIYDDVDIPHPPGYFNLRERNDENVSHDEYSLIDDSYSGSLDDSALSSVTFMAPLLVNSCKIGSRPLGAGYGGSELHLAPAALRLADGEISDVLGPSVADNVGLFEGPLDPVVGLDFTKDDPTLQPLKSKADPGIPTRGIGDLMHTASTDPVGEGFLDVLDPAPVRQPERPEDSLDSATNPNATEHTQAGPSSLESVSDSTSNIEGSENDEPEVTEEEEEEILETVLCLRPPYTLPPFARLPADPHALDHIPTFSRHNVDTTVVFPVRKLKLSTLPVTQPQRNSVLFSANVSSVLNQISVTWNKAKEDIKRHNRSSVMSTIISPKVFNRQEGANLPGIPERDPYDSWPWVQTTISQNEEGYKD